MTSYALNSFFRWAVERSRECRDPADCVLALSPLMLELIERSAAFLDRQKYRTDPGQYARYPICVDHEAGLSLAVLVWSPGQWTPIHDHADGWGVVGVVRGVLEERNYVRMSPDRGLDEGIRLRRGGVTFLGPGAVTSFVPNSEHIHVAGVPPEGSRAMSLHLYGRTSNSYNTYDLATGTRRRVAMEAQRELA
jgi:predicted metal-dependent enzyme (double-stranded beta helix superfamily)